MKKIFLIFIVFFYSISVFSQINKLYNNNNTQTITNDIEKLDNLITTLPEFEKLEDMEEAFHLLNQARSLLETLRDNTLKEMNKTKKNINFIKSGITFHR